MPAEKHDGKPIDAERDWQNIQLLQLPSEIVELVLITMEEKGKRLKIL